MLGGENLKKKIIAISPAEQQKEITQVAPPINVAKTTRKQPENFINETLNKYNIRVFDYEHMLFIIVGSCFS